MNSKEISNADIMLRGQLLVNLPAILIMMISIILLGEIFELGYRESVLISIIPGWIYWSFSIKKWIKWSLKNNVDRDRLYKIGRNGLLIWNKENIDEVADNKHKPWF